MAFFSTDLMLVQLPFFLKFAHNKTKLMKLRASL